MQIVFHNIFDGDEIDEADQKTDEVPVINEAEIINEVEDPSKLGKKPVVRKRTRQQQNADNDNHQNVKKIRKK